MSFREILITGCACATLAVLPAAAAQKQACASVTPAAGASPLNFQKEADGLFTNVRDKAVDADMAADLLTRENGAEVVDWEVQTEQLDQLTTDIDGMGVELCRLEQIRASLAPWQQKAVDRMAAEIRLMADNTDDAIEYGNANHGRLRFGTYKTYVTNLSNEASALARSMRSTVEYAKVRKEYRELRGDVLQSE
jgi:hypothetical protein